MNSSHPPRVAQWLLERWASDARRQSLVGDLLEQYQRGRSPAWYWRQAVGAIVISAVTEVWQHKWIAMSVVAVGIYLPDFYVTIPTRWLDAWYPHLINSRWSWLAINPWAYRLQLYWLTVRVTWCALLASVAWLAVRSQPRQRRMVLTLFLITQVGECVPYMQYALANWLHEPGNPMWFFHFAWSAVFALVAVPASILLGGFYGAPRSFDAR